MMKQIKLPTAEQLYAKRTLNQYKQPKKIWDLLEEEMQYNAATGKKPYNEKVGDWLRFLKELKHHFAMEAKKNLRKLCREAGPDWFFQLSDTQIKILEEIPNFLYEDELNNKAIKIRKGLIEIGITTRFNNKMLMTALRGAKYDTGLFMWNLFTLYYKKPPSERLAKYDMNSRLMMSAIVFIDIKECTQALYNLTTKPRPPSPPVVKKITKYWQPDIKYGAYLARMKAPRFTVKQKKRNTKPPVFDYKIKLRNKESFEELAKQTAPISLEKRHERLTHATHQPRQCKYKFWKAPYRHADPKLVDYNKALTMFKVKAKPLHTKYKVPYENIQCHIGNVCYIGGRPKYLMMGFNNLPTGYTIHNGGFASYNGLLVTNILGHYLYPKKVEKTCDINCTCLEKWSDHMEKFFEEHKCTCGHLYDMENTGKKALEKYFHPPTRYLPMYFDEPTIYQCDPLEDYIKDCVSEALRSNPLTPTGSETSISPTKIPVKVLLRTLLADLMDTPLLIPHLPDANLLLNLQAWTRKRVRGDYTPKKTLKLICKSQRRWVQINHLDFRARSYMIPFTRKQLNVLNYSHQRTIEKLHDKLYDDYKKRNIEKQLEESRLVWSTMHHDMYPSDRMLSAYYAYLPANKKNALCLEPFDYTMTKRRKTKPCSLAR